MIPLECDVCENVFDPAWDGQMTCGSCWNIIEEYKAHLRMYMNERDGI